MDGLSHRVDGIAQRHPRRQVERQRHRRELALMVDLGRQLRVLEMGEAGERHKLAGGGRHANILQCTGVELVRRIQFQHDVILVNLGKDGRHFALAQRVVQRVVDELRADAVLRGAVAVYHHRRPRRGVFQVAVSRR